MVTSIENGLSSAEAESRVGRYGYNEVALSKRSPVIVFFKKFTGLTADVIEFSIIVAFFLRKDVEASIILALLCINAVISSTQEGRAERAVALLQKKIVINAKTLRDGL